MEESRTANSVRNVKTGMIVQLVNKLMSFVVRTVFIKLLNTDYLGVHGLFSNVLTILSFAELGIGNAIIFSMYKPVAEDDKEKIKSLMKLYKTSYTIIGVLVFIIGLVFIPFMDFIIKDPPNVKENLIFIYILYLLYTSLSYFFTYKKSIISAYQKQSVINNIDSVIFFIKCSIQIGLLFLTHNFIVYLIIDIIATLFENIYVSKKADKMYPFLKDKNIQPLKNKEKKDIFENVKALVIYKFGGVILDGTDNLIISSMINVTIVGFCSNYTMIITAVKSVITSALNGITASVGNLNAIGTGEQKESVFYQITFVGFIIYSFCAIALMTLLNPFIELWLGASFALDISIPIALATSFFIMGLRTPGYTYRITLGLFKKGKLTPYIASITNIVLSIGLGKLFGVTGIFIATSIAQLVSYCWIDPYLIHKYEFKKPVGNYLKKFIIYILVFFVNSALTITIVNFVNIRGIKGLVIKGVITVIVPNMVNLILFCRTLEFKVLFDRFVKPIIDKKIFRKN